MHGVREPSKKGGNERKPRGETLGLVVLTRWYACLQAKLGNSPGETLFVTTPKKVSRSCLIVRTDGELLTRVSRW